MAKDVILKTERYKAVKKANIISTLVNAVQALIKILGGLFGGSPALFADGIHSFSDLLANGLVWLTSKLGHAGPDEDHPYGHGRFETFGSFTLGLFLAVVAVGIVWDAVVHIIDRTFIVPEVMTLVVALISVILNEFVFRYSLNIATKIKSSLLRANAYHSRADSYSSIIVIVGILGALAGLHYADAIATVLVAVFVFKIAIELIWRAAHEMTEAGVELEKVQAYKAVMMSLSGVQHMHQLRTRKLGDRVFLDVHILIAPYSSASEGHYIAETVHYHLKKKFNEIEDMTIHVDTEDHPETVPERLLPDRREIEVLLLPYLKIDFTDYNGMIDLFYFRNHIEVQVVLPVEALQKLSHDEWVEKIKGILKKVPDITTVAVRFGVV